MPRRTSQSPPRRQASGKGSGGTPADRLIKAWLDEDDDAFAELAEALIAEGRDGVLSAALRKLAERYQDDAVDDFAAALTEVAEAAEGLPGLDFAELVLLPVVLAESGPEDMPAGGPKGGPAGGPGGVPGGVPAGGSAGGSAGGPGGGPGGGPEGVPDAAALAQGLARAGVFPPEAAAVFAEGWRSAEAVGRLSPAALRRVLLAIAGRQPSADLPALPADAVAESGIAVLVGAVTYTGPASGDPEADPELAAATEEAQEQAQAEAFDRWRDSLGDGVTRGALILPPCPPSGLAEEIEALLDEAGKDGPPLDEVADFIDMAREEAGGEEILARLVPQQRGVELVLLTRAGRALDRRVFGATEDGPGVAEIRDLVGSLVTILDGPA